MHVELDVAVVRLSSSSFVVVVVVVAVAPLAAIRPARSDQSKANICIVFGFYNLPFIYKCINMFIARAHPHRAGGQNLRGALGLLNGLSRCRSEAKEWSAATASDSCFYCSFASVLPLSSPNTWGARPTGVGCVHRVG